MTPVTEVKTNPNPASELRGVAGGAATAPASVSEARKTEMNPGAEVTDFAMSVISKDDAGAKLETTLPEPLSLPWELKPLSSARSGLKTLKDGRRCFWVDEFLKGVTPKMLVWWFSHLEGEVEIGDRLLSRYRVFHPFDHCWARYVRRGPDGSIGPGAQIQICEFIARNPRYKTKVTATIEKLDESGFINNVVVAGLSIVRMEHDFHQTEGGTRFEHRLITPGNKKLWLLSKPISAFMFPNPKGQAWLKHAIEEMGSLENFLPQLYEREVART